MASGVDWVSDCIGYPAIPQKMLSDFGRGGDVGDSGDYSSQFQATLCVASRGVELGRK